MAPYLRPTAPIAADVLLPADPALAMRVAQRVTAKPRMANHHHGLWGYSGGRVGGGQLTVQASGVGGPSAAAVLVELAEHGARRVVRLGHCTALAPGIEPGEALVVDRALGADGVSRALGVKRAAPDPALTGAVAAALGARRVVVASGDLEAPVQAPDPAATEGAAAYDLETAAVLALGSRLGLSLAAVLVVTGGAADEARADARLAELAPALVGAFEAAGPGAAIAGAAGA